MRLRRHDRLRRVPVVIYSARDLDGEERARLRVGSGTELLSKGRITPQHFGDRVVKMLGRITERRVEVGVDGS